MVRGNPFGVAADGVTDLGNEPLPFSTPNPSKLLLIPVATADKNSRKVVFLANDVPIAAPRLAISSELGMRPLMERVLSRREILEA